MLDGINKYIVCVGAVYNTKKWTVCNFMPTACYVDLHELLSLIFSEK